VGAEATADDDDLPFEERMEQLTAQLKGQFAESARLEQAILKNLASLGFTGKASS
jgi:type I restriction enzyme M protein